VINLKAVCQILSANRALAILKDYQKVTFCLVSQAPHWTLINDAASMGGLMKYNH